MHIRSFKSIAICALAFGLTGCRVQQVLVMPTLTPFSYAAPGDTLEWLPINSGATFYVVFDGVPPCADQYYKVEPGRPARCKVLKGHNGFFLYHFQTTEPSRGTILYAKSCPYCNIAVKPGSNNSAVLAKVAKSADGLSYNLAVSCQNNTAVVDNSEVQDGVQDGSSISWYPTYPSKGMKVTTSNMCSGGNNGVFTVTDACTVTGTPATTPYPYSVHLDQCNDGPGSLIINPLLRPSSRRNIRRKTLRTLFRARSDSLQTL